MAERLGAIDGVVGIALGGSLARGTADARSDVDIGIFYRPERPPSLTALDALAKEIDDRHRPGLVTDYGEWGPWINGGAWLQIDGRHVDWLYRDLDRVGRTVEDCRAGRITCDYQPGHPHGFHNHIYMAEVHFARPLYDPHGVLTELRARTDPYPPALRAAIVDRYLWEAGFALDVAESPAERGDTFHVTGCLFRSVACLIQVLFALNERYFVNEKGSLVAVKSFAVQPPRFYEVASEVLAQPGGEAGALRAGLTRLRELVAEVRELERRGLS